MQVQLLALSLELGKSRDGLLASRHLIPHSIPSWQGKPQAKVFNCGLPSGDGPLPLLPASSWANSSCESFVMRKRETKRSRRVGRASFINTVDEIHFALETMGKPLLVGICKGIESFQGSIHGAGFGPSIVVHSLVIHLVHRYLTPLGWQRAELTHVCCHKRSLVPARCHHAGSLHM